MPHSPSLRCSPGREHRMDNTHKRGHSFKSGLPLRAKDDDLALFNDMQIKETENFLLHTADDFDDSLSKLRYLSDFKLDITIRARGESSDLLNADGEKNDYDWLLTPPDTPLFPSLDNEEPSQTQNLAQSHRPRSQPINISRSSSADEKTRMSSRGSVSPRRLSPSPRSSNNFGQLVSRPSSAPRSSTPPLARPVTPSRRPSTPPNKPSTPTPRSSTPTLRRMSTGSSGQASSSGRRGTSPMRASRGNSASPKLRGWQSNLPGFSSDAPPNLRTSLSDRPSPHVRGLSPTPRSGRGRQSLSPTASRSVSSSHSNDRDIFSSYSKGSGVSSGDDDMDSLHSVAISSSPPARRNGMSVNSRPMALSKKPSRTSPSDSIPKRSFESVLRQMDHRKTPQNMFRPLLSSVPSTTFYVGKTNSTQRPVFSRNSSLTTSTSASSDQGASVAPDLEGNEHDQNDLTGEWKRTQEHDNQVEVFIFDKVDDIIEDGGQELHAGNPLSSDAAVSNKVSVFELEDSMVNFRGAACAAAAAESAHPTGDLSVVDCCEIMAICSKCGKCFHLLGVDGKTDLCQKCLEIDGLFAAGEPLLPATISQDPTVESKVTIGVDASVNEVLHSIGVSELPERCSGEIVLDQHENNIEEGFNCLDNSCPAQLVMDEAEPHIPDQQLDSQKDGNAIQCDSGNKFVQTEPTAHPSLTIDSHEGTGISVLLLQRSSGSKWPVVQSRAFSAANILCAEPSYVRDNNSAMRRSIGRDSASASSSVDIGPSRQIDALIQRQISNRKIEVDSARSDTDAKSQCSGSHSDLTNNAYEPSFLPKNDTEESYNSSIEGVENGASQESVLLTWELDSSSDRTDMSAANFSTCKADSVDSDAHINDDCFNVKNTSNLQLLSYMDRHHYETSAADNLKDEDCPSCINATEELETEKSFLDIEVPNNVSDSFIIAEQSVLNDPSCQSDISDVATDSSFIILGSQEDHDSSQDLQTECGTAQIPNNEEAIHKRAVSTTPEKDVVVSSMESDLDDHAHGIHDESTVIVEGPTGHMSRSLTLAEVTDTILFCSSIIHDIAYKAATIGMEELVLPPEASRPTVTIPCKSVNDQNNSRKVPNKHTPKSQKFKSKKLETQTKSPLTESGNNVIVQGSTPPSSVGNIPKKASDSTKPPELESKCNCIVM